MDIFGIRRNQMERSGGGEDPSTAAAAAAASSSADEGDYILDDDDGDDDGNDIDDDIDRPVTTDGTLIPPSSSVTGSPPSSRRGRLGRSDHDGTTNSTRTNRRSFVPDRVSQSLPGVGGLSGRLRGQQQRQQQQRRRHGRQGRSQRGSELASSPSSSLVGGDEDGSDNSDYRGFNTSITDMFADPDQERVDCCALVCCGCCQSDRDRYIVAGIQPVSCWRRFCSHVMSPIIIFGMAMYVAVNIPDPFLNQMMCYAFVVIMILHFISQCCRGAWKRREVRKNLLWVKFHKNNRHGVARGQSRRPEPRGSANEDAEDTSDYDTDYDDDSVVRNGRNGTPEYYQGQTRADMWNSHSFIGCYVTDRKPMPLERNHDTRREQRATFLTRIFQCLTGTCCGKMCGVHIQLCGFCAVAQEGRQLEALIRPAKRRIDYMTMQPYMEYYPAIYEARHTTSPTSWWYQRLSLLSRWALISTAGVVLSLFAVSMLSLRKNIRFGPMNFLIFFLTLLQSWAVVIMVYWKSRKDVSFDALVKFFASGFWLSTSLAVFYELLFGFIIRATMGCLMAMSGVDEVEQNGYQYTPLAFIGSEWMVGQVNYSGYRAYLEVYGNDHPVIYTLYLFMVTFFLAAGVEEICKYFGFRMIEHPDQLSRAEIEDAAECTENEERHESFFTDQDRPHHSRAASVTVSMVTVAAGFACAENLVYVFLYGGSAVSTQASILLIRSFFPIHPVAAALQSVRVVQRDVEKDADMKLGGILKPAVVFHGLFDFVVLFTSYIGSRQGKWTDEDDSINMSTEDGSDKAGTVASVFVLLGGALYYISEARKQRRRLKNLDGESVNAEDFAGSIERPFMLA